MLYIFMMLGVHPSLRRHTTTTATPWTARKINCLLFLVKGMGDHLALLVDRLLTESTLEAAIGNREHSQIQHLLPSSDIRVSESFLSINNEDGRSAQKMVECRICQDEDFDTNMEIPCSCCGSLKYAHRKCVQRWCNEKGDTTCEICLQEFEPGYTAPQQLFHYGSVPMNFRGNWEISRRDLHDSQIITMVPSDRGFVGSDYDDYTSLRTRSSIGCRSVAIIFMVLLVLRHVLPLIISGAEQYSFTLFSLLVLRTVGVIFPIVVMVRALAIFHRRRRQQENRELSSETEVENIRSNSLQLMRSQPNLVRVN